MARVAVLDDWQGVAQSSTDWGPLKAAADLVFFNEAFGSDDEAVAALNGFEIILSMRERTKFPASLITRLPKLRMLGITGKHNRSLDVDACTAKGILVCNTESGTAPFATAELALGLLLSAARSIPPADNNLRSGQFQEGLPVGISLAGRPSALWVWADLVPRCPATVRR